MSENTTGSGPRLTVEPPLAHEEQTERATSSSDAGSGATKVSSFDAVGCAQSLKASLGVYVQTHPYTVMYGVVGFFAAVLILIVGLWNTIVIAVFTGVGVLLGQARDGDNALVNCIRKLFGGAR